MLLSPPLYACLDIRVRLYWRVACAYLPLSPGCQSGFRVSRRQRDPRLRDETISRLATRSRGIVARFYGVAEINRMIRDEFAKRSRARNSHEASVRSYSFDSIFPVVAREAVVPRSVSAAASVRQIPAAFRRPKFRETRGATQVRRANRSTKALSRHALAAGLDYESVFADRLGFRPIVGGHTGSWYTGR